MLAFFKGLGLGFACLLLFVVGVVFGVEYLNKKENTAKEGLNFSRELEVSKSEMPDQFKAVIEFWANENLSTKLLLSEKEKEQIATSFNTIAQRVNNDKLCVGGSYSLKANFALQEGMQIPKGYTLRSNLTCEFNKEQYQAFDTLLKDIQNIVAKSDFIDVSTPNITQDFLETTRKNTQEELYTMLIKEAYALEQMYSKNLNKTCILKTLNANSQMPRLANAKFSLSNTETQSTLPLIKEQIQSLNGVANFICH